MDKEIFFHVGLSKTASTYLQNKFFNKLSGITYIGNHNYKNYTKIIPRLKDEKILVSREFDQQFDEELINFSEFNKKAKVIIVLRRHDTWIASQYRRYVKNGGRKDFEQFFDIKSNNGLWKIKEADFFSKIKKIEELFDEKPLVLFYEELKESPFLFLDKISEYTKTNYEKNNISLTSKHKSYSEKQLKFLKKSCFFFKSDFKHSNYFLSRSRWFICHIFLLIGSIIPEKFLSKKPLISPNSLKEVKNYFNQDWKRCKEYSISLNN